MREVFVPPPLAGSGEAGLRPLGLVTRAPHHSSVRDRLRIRKSVRPDSPVWLPERQPPPLNLSHGSLLIKYLSEPPFDLFLCFPTKGILHRD